MKYILLLLFVLIACNDTPTSTTIDVDKGDCDTLCVVKTDTLYVSLDSIPCKLVYRRHGKIVYVCVDDDYEENH